MKHVSHIISHIKQQPSFKKIKQIASYKKLLALLPPKYTDMVKFMYNKNNTLFFVLKHPGFKMEFNYKMITIKGLLKKLIEYDESCKCIDADELKFFVTNKPPQDIAEVEFKYIYEERSNGDFTNKAHDKKLNLLFEEIRELICKKT